ncbi:MAG TPA: TA system VapC family ribonuclease toxin [Bryobacteraceae bacterium]|nr:TA system VapC family ribonuclease toxin [Bryobacteraceae bacterium]
MNKPALLDVNVLIALMDANHQFHLPAHAWLERNQKSGWATTAITQNGCLRIMSRPGYPVPGLSFGQVCRILAKLVAAPRHLFWTDSISLLDGGRVDLELVSSRHLTDIYLLGLAIANEGRLVTFDQSIPWRAVAGAGPDDVVVLPAR